MIMATNNSSSLLLLRKFQILLESRLTKQFRYDIIFLYRFAIQTPREIEKERIKNGRNNRH